MGQGVLARQRPTVLFATQLVERSYLPSHPHHRNTLCQHSVAASIVSQRASQSAAPFTRALLPSIYTERPNDSHKRCPRTQHTHFYADSVSAATPRWFEWYSNNQPRVEFVVGSSPNRQGFDEQNLVSVVHGVWTRAAAKEIQNERRR